MCAFLCVMDGKEVNYISILRKIWIRKEISVSSVCQTVAACLGRFPVIWGHLKQIVDGLTGREMNGGVYVLDREISKARIGGQPLDIGIRLRIKHLLQFPQMPGAGDHIKKYAAGLQHPLKFVQTQGREAIDEQIDVLAGDWQVIRRSYRELNARLTFGSPAQAAF